MAADLYIDERLMIAGSDLAWTSTRSSGPGGQNVNKVATKVELRFDLGGCRALSPPVKVRLRRLAAGRLDARGRVVVTSQLTRNRVRNLADARRKLAELIARALIEPKRRRPTKPSRRARERRLTEKRRQADKKRQRDKVRY